MYVANNLTSGIETATLCCLLIARCPQASTGFSPFELLYGWTVRGPKAILKELWSGECDLAKVKTSYQYVLELKKRLEETTKLAQD